MDVASAQPRISTTASPATMAESPATTLAADLDTFLRMLTAQIENQDPLNPLDSADFATQLATFSGVEQQVQTNEILGDLAARLGASGVSDLAGWVGLSARTTGQVAFTGAPVTLAPDVPAGASEARILVRDGDGTLVQTLPVAAGTDRIDWVGTSGGAPLSNGAYSFTLTATADGETFSRPVDSYQTVIEARAGATGTELVFGPGVVVDASDVLAVRGAQVAAARQ